MKLSNILLWNALWGIMYFGTNNFCLFTPHELPLLAWEKNLPLNEAWMIPYFSWFAYNILFLSAIKRVARRFAYYMTGLVFIHALVFIFCPVIYPRTYDAGALCPLNQYLLSYDNPQNCLPSLHVSFTIFTLLAAKKLGIVAWQRHLFLIWGVIITISVVFVKQHYVFDVFTSLLLCATYYFLIVRKKLILKQDLYKKESQT